MRSACHPPIHILLHGMSCLLSVWSVREFDWSYFLREAFVNTPFQRRNKIKTSLLQQGGSVFEIRRPRFKFNCCVAKRLKRHCSYTSYPVLSSAFHWHLLLLAGTRQGDSKLQIKHSQPSIQAFSLHSLDYWCKIMRTPSNKHKISILVL